MKKAKGPTVSIVLALMLCGCASVGRKLDANQVDQIKKGETTKEQVAQLVGNPDQATKDSDGVTTWLYTYSRATAKASNFIPIVGAFAGGFDTETQSVTVTFGTNGIVSNVISSYGAQDLGTGLNTGGKARISGVEDNKRPK